MLTAKQIATDALVGYAPGCDISREDVWSLVQEVIEAERAQVKHGYLVFTGTYEIWHSFDQARERVEGLLDDGHATPTCIKVELTEEEGTDVLGITAHKTMDTSKAGEIR